MAAKKKGQGGRSSPSKRSPVRKTQKTTKKTARKKASAKKAGAKKADAKKRTGGKKAGGQEPATADTKGRQAAERTVRAAAEGGPKRTGKGAAAKGAAKKSVKRTAKRSASKASAKKKTGERAGAKKNEKKRGASAAAKGKAKAPALPALHELDEVPTEDLWGHYRRACAKPADHAQYLEDLRNLLIERHYPLVRYIAERLLQTLPKSIELDDLISAGLFGLMDAIRGFDPSRGIKFKTYCSTRIRGSILDQLRSQDWVPRLVRLKAGRIERALQRLTGEYGREPTHAELAKSLEMEHDDLVREIHDAHAKTMFSLSEKWEDDDGSVEKVEILEDKTAVDPVNELNRRDLMRYMTRSLTHKERFIIEQYYQYGHTMREIGEMLALTESRVCQIHSNVMGRLKSLLQQREESLST